MKIMGETGCWATFLELCNRYEPWGCTASLQKCSPLPPPLLHSNSCTCPASSAWPSWGSRGASCTGPAVPSAAWPETPTVPGMDRPAPDTSPWAGGNEDGEGGRLSARVTRVWTRCRIYSYCVQPCLCWLLLKNNRWSSSMWHISTTWFFFHLKQIIVQTL